MFNNKKGEELGYFEILDLILLIVVAGSFSVFLMNLSSDTYFERNFLARDLSLMEHALYASPGDVIEYQYYPLSYLALKVEKPSSAKSNQIDLSNFDFSFTTNKVSVSDKGETNGVSYFAYNKDGFTDKNLGGVNAMKFKESENLEIE